jgi:hypothetical protein
MKTFGDEKWSNPLILFWTVFLGMRNEATPNSVLNCFGDENWSNPWIRPNRHPSRRYCCADSWRWCCANSNVLEEFLDLGISISSSSLLLRGFLTLLLHWFQCSLYLKLGLNDKIDYLFLFNWQNNQVGSAQAKGTSHILVTFSPRALSDVKY